MSRVVEVLSVDDSLATARRQLERGRIRHLPVVDGDERLVGLLTQRRILDAWVSHGHPDPSGLVVAERMRMRNVNRSRCWQLVFLAVLLPLSACASPQAYQPPQRMQAARAVETPKRNDPAEPLSPAARELLKARMGSHARDMNDLVLAIMLLDYLRIEQRGDQIADDVSLSRPLTNDATELNASLPEKFFVHQDKLKVEARALADAARARNPYQVAEQYGRLSEGCVRCHADYRPRS